METVGPPVDDVELHLLTEWGDPASRGRSGVASVASVLLHIAGIVLIVLLPSDFLSSPPEPAEGAAADHPAGGTAHRIHPAYAHQGQDHQGNRHGGVAAAGTNSDAEGRALHHAADGQTARGHPDPAAARSRRPARTSQDRGGGQRAAKDRTAAHQFHRAAASADGREAETGAGKRRRAAASRRLRRKAK